MNDSHGETYIVHVARKAGSTVATVERNDGQWYDEMFTEIGKTADLPEIGAIIESDFRAKDDPARPREPRG